MKSRHFFFLHYPGLDGVLGLEGSFKCDPFNPSASHLPSGHLMNIWILRFQGLTASDHDHELLEFLLVCQNPT